MLASMGFSSWCRGLFPRTSQSGPTAFQAAADEGNADTQFALGLKYSSGSEASRDLAQAASWYRKAADQNHALAQFNLSLMLAGGFGVPQDDAAALSWVRRAAESGDAGAQFSLGMRCHRSSVHHSQMDSAESRIEAYKWFQLAAAQGYIGSEDACQRVTMGMSREEVTDGNERAATFAVKTTAQPQEATSVTPLS